MATIFDDKFLAVAVNIIEKFGVTATLKQKSDAAYDPILGVVTDSSVDNIITSSPPIAFKKEAVDGVLVQANDFKAYVYRGAITDVDAVDEISINGVEASVIGVDPIYSGEEVAVWSLHCRR
jgi:hypothetical protein